MSRIVKFAKTVRNNWKKSLFGAGVLAFGGNYGINKYNTEQLMVAYCLEAAKFGREAAGPRLRRIVVILNPSANRRKAKKNFEKFCAPLLHLAGICVDIIQTEFEGQARTLAEKLESNVDGVIVAGGDGTLSEAVTGLLRKAESEGGRRILVGVLPLGRSNTVANSLFGGDDGNDVKVMAEAAMAVVKEVTKPLDVMKIQVLEAEGDTPGKPVYSLRGVEWGAFRDAKARHDKYWYWDGLRSYMSYVFTGMKGEDSGVCWQCDAELAYSLPCEGCSKCYLLQAEVPKEVKPTRWWQAFVKRPKQFDAGNANVMKVDYSKVTNEECGDVLKEDISTVDLAVTTANVQANCKQEGTPHIEVSIGPPTVNYFDFISEGWRRIQGKEPSFTKTLRARELKLIPKMVEKKPEIFDDFSGSVEGEMIVPNQQRSQQQQGQPEFNTLDEPIRDTVLRDLKAVGVKFFHVLYPKEKKSLLKEWDLWGPLVLCTFMAMVLRGSSSGEENDGGPEVAEVFVIVWIGSMIVTLNSKLLGGNISFFQSVCVLGYCLLPTAIALIVCRIILFMGQSSFLFVVRFAVTMLGFGWATFASMVFLGDSQPLGRKALAVYPIFLFYFVISWLVISNSSS